MLTEIGPYRVLRPIARGGNAEVYEVQDPATQEHYALKLLSHVGSAQRRFKRFNREYEALTRLNHPSVVRVYHYGVHDGSPWLTMELLDGIPLQVQVKRIGRPGTPQRTAEAIWIGNRIGGALQYIHDRGLVHRDLKSANVVVLPDGRVKLLDFGTAHVVDALEPITREGEFVGTFAYASPEQLRGQQPDHRSDLYSLGVLLYRMTTGRRPFDSPSPKKLAELHIKEPPRPPRSLVPNLPRDLNELILELLAKSPDDRPQSAKEVVHALREIAGVPDRGPCIAVRDDRAVGREWQHREVVNILLRPKSSHTVLVGGTPGSGRARFVSGVAEELEALGWVARSVDCGEARAVATVAHMFQNLAALIREPTEVVLEAAEGLGKLGDFRCMTPEAQQRLVVGACHVVQELTGLDVRIVLVFHDLQLARPEIREVIASVHRALAILRSAEVSILATCTVSPTGWWTTAMIDASTVELIPLDVPEVALAVGAMMHRRPPPTRLAQRIYDASGGLPIFVEEVVREMAESGALQAMGDGGRVQWAQPRSEVRVSPQAAERIDRGFLALPASHREVLEGVAVAGEVVTTGLLCGALSYDPEALDICIDGLVDTCWLSCHNGRIRWVNPLAKDRVIGQLHPCRRKALERTMADMLAGGAATPDQARLLLASGRVDEALECAVDCAEALEAAGRPVRALEVLEPVVLQMPAVRSVTSERRAEAYLLHARCLLDVRPNDSGALNSLTLAKAMSAEKLPRVKAQRIGAELHCIMGRYPQSRKTLQKAWKRAGVLDAPDLQSSIALRLGQEFLWHGEPRTARDWFQRARDAGGAAEDLAVQAAADLGVARFLYRSGQLIEAERGASSAMRRLERAGDVRGAWSAAALWTEVLREQGRFSRALEVLAERLPQARRSQIPSLYVELLLAAARCEADLFRLGRAQELVDELMATIRTGEYLHLQLEAGLVRGRLWLASGHPAWAREVLDEVYGKARDAKLVSFAEQARSLLAEAVWALGERDHAADLAEAAWLGLLGTGDLVALGVACVSWSRAVGVRVDPELIFQPVAELFVNQDAMLLRVEHELARASWFSVKRNLDASRRAYRDAANLLNRVASRLNETERAALRLHPWARRIRRGLRT